MSLSLQPLTSEERDDMLSLFAAVESVDKMWKGWAAIDAAARFVVSMRYGQGRGDPLTLLAELETRLRELR